MKVVKFSIAFLFTCALIYLFDNSLVIKGNRIPPLGKFLDPFEGFWQNIEARDQHNSIENNLAGLKDSVTIYLDSMLVPHIVAKNDEDLYLAQGYITAKHRMWQMEFQTHAGAGRLSEIIGPGRNNVILDYDRSRRRQGMLLAAQNSLKGMETDPVTKLAVEKYTEGINQYIHSLSYKDLPLEYKLLDYTPENWTPLKCALLLRNMAYTLNMREDDIELTNAFSLFGKEAVNLLYPDNESVGDAIVEKPGKWGFTPTSVDGPAASLPEELIALQTTLVKQDPTTGSNNWAVSGSKTKSGSPILCNDPHLTLSLPSIWYAVQLQSPSVNVMGVSLPGAPTVIIGFNDSIAWGVTNGQRDLVDWYKISFKDASKNEYLLDNKWVKSNKVVEVINVRGQQSFMDTIVYTHWGPVTYDESFHATDNKKHYALRWISHDPSNEFLTFHKLNRANNYNDYLLALNSFISPAQNFAFASVSGDIAMRVQGKFPIRRKDEGKFVLDGSKSGNGWQAFIPNEHNVMEKNPERGFISSANQIPADSTYPYYIHSSTYEAYRNRRINTILRNGGNFTPEDMMRLQNDNYNLKAAESLPYFLEQLKDVNDLNETEKKAIKLLAAWDYYNTAESEAASYYEAWWDELMPLTWDELKRENIALVFPTTYQTIKLLKQQPDLSWFDVQGTPEKENAKSLLILSFKKGIESIEKWKQMHVSGIKSGSIDSVRIAWADYKDSYIGHLLRLEPLSIPVKSGGNHDIVNAHSRTHGPSWRMITSMEKTGVKAWATYPGGQSGNPGSKHYDYLLGKWTIGRYFPLLFLHGRDKSNDLEKIQLNPAHK